MKRLFIIGTIVLSILITIFLFKMRVRYHFFNDESKICTIEIVIYNYYNKEQNVHVTETLYEVKDIEQFIDDFLSVECYTSLFMEPLELPEKKRVIKIIYANGDYELIGQDSQFAYGVGEGVWLNGGYYWFEQTEFYSLLSKYRTK